MPQKPAKRGRIPFARPGQKSFYKQKHTTIDDTSWNGQWEIASDLLGCERFFPIPTSKKPDIVVWCPGRKVVMLVELTVPYKDNIEAAHVRKDDRYQKLLDECEDAGWEATHFSVEVGCRGFIGERECKWLTKIGLNNREKSSIMKEIHDTVEKASH